MRKVFFTLILVSLTFINISAQIEIKVEKLSDRTIVLKYFTEWGALNVIAVNTEKGIIVIDTAYPLAVTRAIREKIVENFGEKKIAYLINTHGHSDHSWGNQVFAEAEIIAHVNSGDIMKERLSRQKLENDFKMTLPTITFNEKMTLDMGDFTFEMVYLGRAHSGADILIHIPEEKILLVGDTFAYRYLPYVSAADNYDIPKWFEVLDYFLNKEGEIEKVICGHWEIYNIDMLRKYRIYLQQLWDGVADAIRNGYTLEDSKEKLYDSISRESFGHLRSEKKDYIKNIEEVWKLQTKK